MKKIFYFICMVLLTVSCSKPKEVELEFGTDPDTRIADTIALVRKTLVEAPYGWKAFLTTEYSGGYGFYMQFGDNDRVKMVADLDAQSSSELKESTFRIRQIMTATLSFDTYTYLTMLQDPNPGSYGGQPGKGMGSDVEFDYIKSNGDTLFFEGRKFHKQLIFVKAKDAEAKRYNSKGYFDAVSKNRAFFKKNPLTSIVVGEVEAEVAFAFSTKKMSCIIANPDGTFTSSFADFANSIDGFEIIDGILINNVELKRFIWKTDNSLVGIDKEGKEYPLKINSSSVVPYLTALGSSFSVITIPDVITYNGWSTDFVTRRAQTKAGIGRWSFSTGSIILHTIDFKFQVVNNKMSIAFNTTTGPNKYVLTYNYTYTIENGKFKFTPSGTPSGNEGLIYNDVRYILQERINTDTFELGYFVNSETGEVMSQFKSVEHPDFYFTGQNN
ncbi:DUF4302 domain-containing protein [Sphingobacterium thalpophilum]|uniref:DUF4302 domain-containing protein n=1 Tax=Sphingobacterium thalpophilum TaxID=259 RepID=UPI0024A69FEA|nr:DUF4302 domain-containing protein [Sphingobacterium thalpophilum]